MLMHMTAKFFKGPTKTVKLKVNTNFSLKQKKYLKLSRFVRFQKNWPKVNKKRLYIVIFCM